MVLVVCAAGQRSGCGFSSLSHEMQLNHYNMAVHFSVMKAIAGRLELFACKSAVVRRDRCFQPERILLLLFTEICAF